MGVASEDCGGAVFVAHELLPIRLIHSPNRHMTVQGSALITRGAMPAATSTLQFIARPIVTIASPPGPCGENEDNDREQPTEPHGPHRPHHAVHHSIHHPWPPRAVGIALIWVDLVLPVPQTVVIAALGIIYGTVLGGLLGSVGLITGGLLGYVLMLTSARRMVKWLVSPQSLNKMDSLFERAGAWAIVLTRSLPYSVPEAIVFLAGLAGMPMGKFTMALTVGSVPTAFAFAAIGAGWADQPILALIISYVLPILLLPIVLYVFCVCALLNDVDLRHSPSRGLTARLRRAHPADCRRPWPQTQQGR